jgi:hypothetical protein
LPPSSSTSFRQRCGAIGPSITWRSSSVTKRSSSGSSALPSGWLRLRELPLGNCHRSGRIRNAGAAWRISARPNGRQLLGIGSMEGIAPPQLANLHRSHRVKRDPDDDLVAASRGVAEASFWGSAPRAGKMPPGSNAARCGSAIPGSDRGSACRRQQLSRPIDAAPTRTQCGAPQSKNVSASRRGGFQPLSALQASAPRRGSSSQMPRLGTQWHVFHSICSSRFFIFRGSRAI